MYLMCPETSTPHIFMTWHLVWLWKLFVYTWLPHLLLCKRNTNLTLWFHSPLDLTIYYTLHNHWKKCFALEYFFSLVFHHKGITFYMPWKKRQKNIWHEPNIQWIIEIGLIYNRHLPYMESMQQIIPLSKQFGLIEAISGALTNIFSVILLDRMRQIQ